MTIAISEPGQHARFIDALPPHRTDSGDRLELDGQMENPPIHRHLSAESDQINGSGGRVILFGPFRLLPVQRLLLDADKPVRLGSRALDILIALAERRGKLVSKRELMRVVWPDTVVVEANLTVHVAALRRALGDGQAGNRYIVNIPGRGYRFIAPVTFAEGSRSPAHLPTKVRPHNLPRRLTRLIGRAEVVDSLLQRVPTQRLITIVGPGGIGKTAVALDVADELLPAYEHGVLAHRSCADCRRSFRPDSIGFRPKS